MFREELRVTETCRKEDIAPLMDPDIRSILLGQVMVTFRRRNKRLHEWVLETDLFKSLLLFICLQFRQTVLLMREKLLILTCKISAWHQSWRYDHVVTGHTSDFWKKLKFLLQSQMGKKCENPLDGLDLAAWGVTAAERLVLWMFLCWLTQAECDQDTASNRQVFLDTGV